MPDCELALMLSRWPWYQIFKLEQLWDLRLKTQTLIELLDTYISGFEYQENDCSSWVTEKNAWPCNLNHLNMFSPSVLLPRYCVVFTITEQWSRAWVCGLLWCLPRLTQMMGVKSALQAQKQYPEPGNVAGKLGFAQVDSCFKIFFLKNNENI